MLDTLIDVIQVSLSANRLPYKLKNVNIHYNYDEYSTE